MGALSLRASDRTLDPPLLSRGLGNPLDGCYRKSGYWFRVDLPGKNGAPMSEAGSGGAPAGLAPDGAEEGFAIYAWPDRHPESGKRAFVIDETGEIFATDNDLPPQGYEGVHRPPKGDAAFLTENSNRSRGNGMLRRGRDGAIWRVVE
jgi:hypothetical protein